MSARQVRIALIAAAAGIVLFRLIWEVNTPFIITWYFNHDDALFVRLAREIASGHWLGRFSEFTLMKGPGYPLFLALSAGTGLPVSVLHALFGITSILVAGWATHRLTGSRGFAAVVFLLLIFLPLPTSFEPYYHRPLRDQIYWGQTLIFFSIFPVVLFAPPERRGVRLTLAAVCGIVLGWAWLTREEGVWFVPAIAVLLAGKLFQWRLERQPLGQAAAGATVVAAGCAAVLAAFMTTNLLVYGRFVGVDFHERNYQRALAALQSIEDPKRVPSVPVSDATLKLAGEASPTFRPLAEILQPEGPMRAWRFVRLLCEPDRCGQLTGGVFVWALRHAADLNGFYASPAVASREFGKVADEINDACDSGRLRCHPSLIGIIPPMSAAQWYELPRSVVRAIGRISLAGQAAFRQQRGPAVSEPFYRYWRFLNYPRVAPPASDTVSGWFQGRTSGELPTFQIESAYHGVGDVPVVFDPPTRPKADDSSQDGVQVDDPPDDTTTMRKRFQITHACPENCTLIAKFADGGTMRLDLPSRGPADLSRDGRTIHVEPVVPEFAQLFGSDRHHLDSLKISNAMRRVYKVLFPTILALGLVCYVAAVVGELRKRRANPIVIVATAAWVLVLTRAILVALVDVSSFSAVNMMYLAPAVPLAGLAAMLSIFVLVRKVRDASAPA